MLVFSEDDAEQCEAVQLLAEILRDELGLDPIFPRWEIDEISRNKALWVQKSLFTADLVSLFYASGLSYSDLNHSFHGRQIASSRDA